MVVNVFSTSVITISIDELHENSVVSSEKLQMLQYHEYVEKQGSKHRTLRDASFYFAIFA